MGPKGSSNSLLPSRKGFAASSLIGFERESLLGREELCCDDVSEDSPDFLFPKLDEEEVETGGLSSVPNRVVI